MGTDLATLFDDFDRGRLSRRQLLKALGVAAVIRPASAFAQGQCGGARAGTPECDPTPAKLPFEPTGWKTTILDHLSCQVVDYPKEAAYYAALMNWKIRSDDGKQAVLDIGDWGGLVLRGGYQAPPAAPTTDAAPPAGRGGGPGGAPRAPRLAVFDGFCWGIEPWDAKHVEAELRKRGLTPVADNDGKDFQSFHVKDPDGFNLQISNGSRKNRRQGPASGNGVRRKRHPEAELKQWLDHILVRGFQSRKQSRSYGAPGWKPERTREARASVRRRRRRHHHRRGGGGNRGCARRGTPAPPPMPGWESPPRSAARFRPDPESRRSSRNATHSARRHER